MNPTLRMTFLVPAEFSVFGIPQSDRPPCNIDCDVVELTRRRVEVRSRWYARRQRKPITLLAYTAYVRLPPWVTPPDAWPRLLSGEVRLSVNLPLNRRVEIPEFPRGSNRLVVDRGEA